MVILLAPAIEAAQFITDGHHIFHIVLRTILLDTIQQEGFHIYGIPAAAAVIQLLIELIESALRNDPSFHYFVKIIPLTASGWFAASRVNFAACGTYCGECQTER